MQATSHQSQPCISHTMDTSSCRDGARHGIQVLRGIPALQRLSDKAFDQLVGRGKLVRYSPDQIIWTPPQSTEHAKRGGIPCKGTGIFVVVVGLVKWAYAPPGQPLRVGYSDQ